MNKRITEATKEEISQVMKDNAIRNIAIKRKSNLVLDVSEETGQVDIYTKYQQKQANCEGLGLEYRLYKSNERRKQRIKSRIESMVSTGKALFLTLTFSNKMFERNTSAETRRRYIARFLKEQCLEYLANIDFGSQNEREHYHAVVVPKTIIDFKRYNKLFDSNINSQHIRVNDTSVKLVGKYINKLTNHALKDNGYYQRLVFSRGKHLS